MYFQFSSSARTSYELRLQYCAVGSLHTSCSYSTTQYVRRTRLYPYGTHAACTVCMYDVVYPVSRMQVDAVRVDLYLGVASRRATWPGVVVSPSVCVSVLVCGGTRFCDMPMLITVQIHSPCSRMERRTSLKFLSLDDDVLVIPRSDLAPYTVGFAPPIL